MKAAGRARLCTDASATADLERGRADYGRQAWAAAYEALSRADQVAPVGIDDLEKLAICAYLIGRDDEYISLLQRAYHAYLAAGAPTSAARSAFWLGLRLMFRGDKGQSSGWLGRAERLLSDEPVESTERGYLLLAAAQLQLDAGNFASAASSAESALCIGERFLEVDLCATARHLLGHIEIRLGNVRAGLAHFDETMVAAVGGELSPIVTGLIFCSVVEACQDVCAFERAQEWTLALAEWCDQQPEMVAFAGICSVHRAEILQLKGAWSKAWLETERAMSRCLSINRRATGAAHYQQGELYRLRGELALAEDAYRCASELGCEPQPGLALVRLAQGSVSAAARSIAPALAATTEPTRRVRLLPAHVEIMLAAGQCEAAEQGSCELAELAERFDSDALRAAAAQARGAVRLAQADALGALRILRDACRMWEGIDAPYPEARARVLLAECCKALEDDDGHRLETNAARAIFKRLGAELDLSRLDPQTSSSSRILSARELQVLRLVATGRTNKNIAGALALSEKTIERHISNICSKLNVPSRTAATAYAYEHRLF
jgi:ATP/maltotriose-dependent transcriptional regulator MalT